jgi:hypothetical protein
MTDSALLSQTPARRMQGCIGEYERIRRRESTAFKTVRDFCICHRFSRRNFMKIYHHLQHLQAAWTEQITPGSKTGTEENYHEQNRGISSH